MIEEIEVEVEATEKRYVLTMTEDELVAIGMLSYSNEGIPKYPSKTFARSLPNHILDRIESELNDNKYQGLGNLVFTNLNVSWREQ